MLFGLTSWKDYEDKVSWGVIVLYAGCISLGSVFKRMATLGWPAALLALSAIIILWWVNILGINPSGMGF